MPLVQERCQPSDSEQQVAFHEPDRNRIADSVQHKQSSDLSQSILTAALLLFGLYRGVGSYLPLPLLGVMHRAVEIGADFGDRALFAALGNNCFSNVLAGHRSEEETIRRAAYRLRKQAAQLGESAQLIEMLDCGPRLSKK